MKNIHILQTNNPSRIYYNGTSYKDTNSTMAMDWFISSAGYKPYNIYITSNEEIKIGDYGYYQVHNCVVRITENLLGNYLYKKIILTTDVDLIKDGVQAINDEFLEWFIQNPSCEEVKVEWLGTYTFGVVGYKIIIPSEYPKFRFNNVNMEEPTIKEIKNHKEDPKQETIEDAAAGNTHNKEYIKQIFFEAIKVTGEGWNGEYAEGNNPIIEEVFNEEFENWFNRFKNK